MYQGMIALLEQFLIDRVISSAAPVSHGSKTWLGLMVLAGFFLCLGSVYLFYAFYLWLLTVYTPQGAAVVTAAMCFGLALLIVAALWLMLQYKKHKTASVQDNLMETVTQLMAYVDEELREPVANNPKAALAIATAVGFLAGKRLM